MSNDSRDGGTASYVFPACRDDGDVGDAGFVRKPDDKSGGIEV